MRRSVYLENRTAIVHVTRHTIATAEEVTNTLKYAADETSYMYKLNDTHKGQQVVPMDK